VWRGNIVVSKVEQDNCQVAVSLSLANHHASLPVAWRLYLPKEWAADDERRRKAGVPDEIDFKTKPEIALEQIKAALKAGLSRGVVLMDAGYGCNTNLRTGISALALPYVAGIMPHTAVWTPGTGPLPPKKWLGRGQRPTRLRHDNEHKPISVEELALSLPKRSWRRVEWREGTAEPLSSRFARVRVFSAGSKANIWLAFSHLQAIRSTAILRAGFPSVRNRDARHEHHLPQTGGPHQTALAYRARLSGAQTRSRARAFRRTRLARLPSPRHAVHRGLRISGLREGEDSPLSTAFRHWVQEICRSQRLPAQRHPQ
jgi:hypothetical protein